MSSRNEIVKKLYPLGYLLDRIGFKKEKQWELISTFTPPLHDLKESRIVEYAWVLRNLNLDYGTLLDVGCGYSKFPILLASLGYRTCAIDLRDYPSYTHPNFMFVKGDIRDPHVELPHATFDRIIIVSTLEHIGTESEEERERDDGDMKAMTGILKMLKRDGKILMTAPFGSRYLVEKGTRIYDLNRLKTVTRGLFIEKMDFFSPNHHGFSPTYSPEKATLVCLKLRLEYVF